MTTKQFNKADQQLVKPGFSVLAFLFQELFYLSYGLYKKGIALIFMSLFAAVLLMGFFLVLRSFLPDETITSIAIVLVLAALLARALFCGFRGKKDVLAFKETGETIWKFFPRFAESNVGFIITCVGLVAATLLLGKTVDNYDAERTRYPRLLCTLLSSHFKYELSSNVTCIRAEGIEKTAPRHYRAKAQLSDGKNIEFEYETHDDSSPVPFGGASRTIKITKEF